MRDNFNDAISFKLQSDSKYTLRIGTCNLIFLNFKMITALIMKKIIWFHLRILFSILREKDIYFEMRMGLSNFCHYFKISINFAENYKQKNKLKIYDDKYKLKIYKGKNNLKNLLLLSEKLTHYNFVISSFKT
jgi:hypothetical protein